MAQDNDNTVEAKLANYSRETYEEDYGQYGIEGIPEAVHEDDEKVVFADEQGEAAGRWADDLNLSEDTVRDWMIQKASDVDYDWISADPVVLLKE